MTAYNGSLNIINKIEPDATNFISIIRSYFFNWQYLRKYTIADIIENIKYMPRITIVKIVYLRDIVVAWDIGIFYCDFEGLEGG